MPRPRAPRRTAPAPRSRGDRGAASRGLVVLAALIILGLVGYYGTDEDRVADLLDLFGAADSTATAQSGDPAADAADAPAARERLAGLTVIEPSGWPDYDRDAFSGGDWADPDGNGCDARNDILARDLTETETDADCRVLRGTLDDPYTGRTIEFSRDQANAVQIDHIYPIATAWRMGAHAWDDDRRAEFYNDPANLLAVDGPANSAKGDSGPAEWRPDDSAFHCRYAILYIDVAHGYDLPVTQAEHNALSTLLDACG
ncbi:HNH endonuclease family protein [Allonocardiopsis opalescens]|uniref:Uncharacterized protein DUF1524 n=1 Tax=Allonocardiopsis opalescens TaxID=1144618 RepID=A0A2T0PTZ1_9ACTN|nr:HNH endonuclease family protein [Allonocardiopsis opalescens]PRX92363.1 uncharacterized protein DUF1524 [Allonocardiopsis opalescens]